MLVEQQPAYVLHMRPYRETSLLLECLTRDYGRMGMVARGIRSEKARLLRAQLEPFQPLLVNLQWRGELATLRSLEAIDRPLRLWGEAALAGLYLNELVVRLTGRQDPHPGLYHAYAQALGRLADGEPLAWTLRRFERDFLQIIGYGLQLECEAQHGLPLQAQVLYRYEVERGPLPISLGNSGVTIHGGDLLALAQDLQPDSRGMMDLRRMMRDIIRFHLGGGDLKAWRVLAAAWSPRR